jgi:hypothetical protein
MKILAVPDVVRNHPIPCIMLLRRVLIGTIDGTLRRHAATIRLLQTFLSKDRHFVSAPTTPHPSSGNCACAPHRVGATRTVYVAR